MQLRIFTEPQQGADYATLLRVAKATEDLGFDAFFRSDHYLKMGSVSGLPGPTDAWATLAGLAVQTERIKLGTLVSPLTFRLPGPLAITVAQIDQMSGGRVELGLGTGWFDAEHAAYGIPFPALGDRFAMFEEQLAIITGLWSAPEGETFSYAGAHYRLTDSPALPKPAQRPRPPVIVGGHGAKRTPRLAAAYADEYNAGFDSVAGTKRGPTRVVNDLLNRSDGVLRARRRRAEAPGSGYRAGAVRTARARACRKPGRAGRQDRPVRRDRRRADLPPGA